MSIKMHLVRTITALLSVVRDATHPMVAVFESNANFVLTEK